MPRPGASQPPQEPSRASGAPGLLEAEAWLDGLINREKQPRFSYSRFGLEAIEAVLEGLGNPERALSCVHLAGSKGKGSTALFCEALLLALGERVGTYTSPHLLRWTERFRIDGAEVAGRDLARAVAVVRPHVDALRRGDSALWPSFFDATTAAAFHLFAEAGVDRAVLEVGLGGRLDSTNACRPGVCVVTQIELEHTDKLGNDLGTIAGEKAGILKPGVPAVMGRLVAEAARVVESRAQAVGAPLERLGVDFDIEATAVPASPELPTPARICFSDGFACELEIGARGDHQLDNAALALAAARALGVHSDAALGVAARRAFLGVKLPGRVEVLGRDPWRLVDSAHTRESAASLARFVESLGASRRRFVLSVSLDKDLGSILDALLGLAQEVVVTRAEPLRALDPAEVAARIAERRPDVHVRVVEDPAAAVRLAVADLPPDALLCVAGSVYLAGVARQVLLEEGSGS